MSITKIRSLFEKKGCIVVAYIFGFFIIIGLANTGTCNGFLPQKQAQTSGSVQQVADLAGYPVSANLIEAQANQAKQMQGGGQLEPAYEFFILGQAVDQSLSKAAIDVLAKQKGLKVTDDVTKKLVESQFPMIVEREKERLVTEKKIKAGATEAEFEAAFKKESNGKGLAEVKQMQVDSVLARLKDPNEGPMVENQILAILLAEAYEKEQNLTLENYKESFKTYNVQRLAFDDTKQTAEQKKQAAEKALSEIKAGMKFEDAMAKYNKGRPTTTLPYSIALLEREESLKPILSLKPGEVSAPMLQGATVAIYKLVSMGANLPPTFEKTKDKSLADFRKQRAAEMMEKEVKALKESKLVWKDPAVELGYQVYKAQSEGIGTGTIDQLNEQLAALAKKATATTASTGLGDKLLGLARYSAFETYFRALPPAKQTEQQEEHVEVLRSVLERNESNTIRLQLFDTYLALKNYEEAGSALLDAAKYNTGTDEQSVASTREIRQRTDKADKDGKIDKGIIASVRKEIARWEQDRIQEEKDRKEAAKPNAAVDKELEKLNDPEAVKKNEAAKDGSKK